jgi:uncharacterized protein YegJ (DUF2314 family)
MPRLPLVLVLALAGVAAIAQTRDESEVVVVAAADPQMADAIRAARGGLDAFLKLAAAPPPGTSGYKLKVMVRDGENTEHFWVIPFQQTATGFAGTLANDPKLVRNVASGQTIQFTRDYISDWGYVRNGRQVGSYTVCALFKKMPAEQADYYRKNHGFDC